MIKPNSLILYSPQTLPSVGGLQYVVHYWAKALVQKGYEVVVVSQTTGADHYEDSYKVIVTHSFLQLRSIIKSADIVLMFNVSLKALPAWLGTGKPLFISHQSGLWYDGQKVPLRQRLKQWVANHWCKANIACSAYIGQNYKNCKVVFNPIRLDVFKSADKFEQSDRIIFFAGRFVSDKGVDLLLDAFHRLLSLVNSELPLKLVIAGGGPDEASLKQQAENLKINQLILWPGMIDQPSLVTFMHSSSIMVVPSRMEPMGMVVAEGLAAGCTMVVARQGGLPEVGGSFCHYFEPNNAADLCRALQEALTCPMRPDPAALKQHLQQFTVEYSVGQVVGMLGS